MITITLPDGSKRPFENPPSVYDVAASIGAGLAKAALAGKVDGKLVDTAYTIASDASLEIVTEKHPHRPGHRQRVLLRFRLRAPVHAGRLAQDRS
jgi:hypothetical protein